MITYDVGFWGVGCVFRINGSVFPKALVWAVPCTIVAGALHHLFHSNEEIIEAIGVGDSAASVFGGFNFILGFLVVFRSQQAYSRWWEGGTLLQQLRGEWFNAFSCLLAFSNHAEEKRDEVARFQRQLVRLFSLLHGSALMQVSQQKLNHFELINLDGFDPDCLVFLQASHDKCEVTLQWIQRLIVEAEQKQILKIAPPILSRVYNELGNGIVNLNNARKIREFPLPFPFAQMIMVMLIFHAVFTPLICAATVKTTSWACLLTFVVTFSFWAVLYIAVELEMPFGDDANDLPLCEMAMDLNKSLIRLMEPPAQAVPKFDDDAGRSLTKVRMDMGESSGAAYESVSGHAGITDWLAPSTTSLKEVFSALPCAVIGKEPPKPNLTASDSFSSVKVGAWEVLQPASPDKLPLVPEFGASDRPLPEPPNISPVNLANTRTASGSGSPTLAWQSLPNPPPGALPDDRGAQSGSSPVMSWQDSSHQQFGAQSAVRPVLSPPTENADSAAGNPVAASSREVRGQSLNQG